VDLNAHYCLGIDKDVNVMRGTCANPNANLVGRLAVVGSSHSRRASASDALKDSFFIENLPCWTPTAASAAAVKTVIAAAKLNEHDCLVLDCFTNSTYTGTNTMGYASPAFQDAAGRYHLEGAVELAPGRSLRVIARMLKELVEVSGAAKVIVMLPVPRYVNEGCCNNTSHVSNINSPGYHEMLGSANHVIKSIVEEEMEGCSKQPLCLNPLAGFGNSSLTECKPSDSRSIWMGGDPVHLSAAAYSAIAALVRDAWLNNSEPQLRIRVDSIVEDVSRGRGRRGGPGAGQRGGSGWSGRLQGKRLEPSQARQQQLWVERQRRAGRQLLLWWRRPSLQTKLRNARSVLQSL
jgi:hypothetical protein